MKPIHQSSSVIICCSKTSEPSNLQTFQFAIAKSCNTKQLIHQFTNLPNLARCILLLLFLMNADAHAGNYTWNGATSTNWATSSNWSPAGVPSTNDTVTLSNGGVNSILLDGNRTITRLVISANTINLNTYELHVSGRSSLNGGAINNGNLKIRGTYAYFQGTNFNCTLDVIAGQIKFSGGTFDKTGSFEQNGSASGYGEGGCTFNEDVTIKNTGTVYLRMGQDAGDTFNGKVYLYSSGNYSLQMAYGDTSYFNDTIYVNSTGGGGINFANGTYGTSILGDSACIVTGSTGISAGTIQFKNINQTATSKNSITASGSVLINVFSNSFSGKVNFSAPNLVVKSTIFGDSTSLTKTGTTLNNTWDGANVYNGVVTITNGNTATAYVKLASQNADTYNKDVYFNAGTGAIQAANAGTNIYNGNVSVNGNNVTFNTSGGTLKFAGEENQEFGGGTITLTFNKLIIDKAGGNVTLNQPITIDSLLQFTSGILYTDTLITLKATATTTGANNLSFVDGTVKKIGNTAFVFPVGDEEQWNPIEITAPSNSTDAFTAQFFLEGQQKGIVMDTTIRNLNTCSYWNLTRNSGSSNVYIYLYFDSIACGIYDSVNLIVSGWNGSKWKYLGRNSFTGNSLAGKIKSDTLTSYYNTFTWSYKREAGKPLVIPINPNLNSSSSTTWNHSISEDFFGYNGANVLFAGQYWDDLSASNVLKKNGITNLRFQGGTVGNYWDWRTGWFIPERELPFDWYYFENTGTSDFPGFHNEGAQFKPNNDIVAARPIYQINNLTSDFNYQLAWLYRASELNLPVKYVELGEEFYLNDEHYKERYTSSFQYIKEANDYTYNLKSILPFQDVKVAVVGSSSLENSPGRRNNWMDIILAKIDVNTFRPDAVTIHQYYSSGLGGQILYSNIGKMFIKAFEKGDDLLTKEIKAIDDKNVAYSLTPPIEAWITEYNLNDDVSHNVGTWAHALFNSIQTLKYLESPLITLVSTHAMTSDAVFGNIFGSTFGFDGLAAGQLPYNIPSSGIPTPQYGFTASGAALNEIALAMKGTNVISHRIDFSNDATAIGNINYLNQPTNTSSYLNLYGWSFEKEEGFEAVIINLGFYAYEILNPCSLVSISTCNNVPQSMVQLVSNDPTAGITNIISSGTGKVKDLRTTNEIAISGSTVQIEPYSLTRIIYRNPNTVTVRLTDDEICEGSETSVLVQGGSFGMPCTLNIDGLSPIISSDSLFMIGLDLAADSYSITATVNGITSTNPVTLTVHPAISVVASITSGTVTPCADEEITLTATVTSSNVNSDLSKTYSYLWVPDNQILDNNPFQQSITIENLNLKSAAFQVFVYDGFCWGGSNVIEFDRGPLSVDLGDDFTVCDNSDNIELRALTTESGLINHGVFHYKWFENNIEIPSQISQVCTTQIPSSSTPITYRVEVWSDNGVNNNEGCPIWDEIDVNIVNCCSCSSNISLSPSPHSNEDGPVNNYSTESELIDNAILFSPTDFTVNPPLGDAETITITGLTSKHFCINGELWIRNVELITKKLRTLVLKKCTLQLGPDALIKVRGRVKLILEGCVLKNCDGSSTMWDGIYADIQDQNSAEPELEIRMFNPAIGSPIPTEIMNAKNAVVARRESPFKIEDCIFDNNYKDIVIEKYNKSALAQSATIIRGCTFSSTPPLLEPYDTDLKFTAIELNDLEGRTLGDVGSANSISNSMYGIYSRNASFTLLNTEFHDMLDDATFPNSGTGIYATSDYDYTNRKITLGNGNANGTNTFLESKNGLMGIGEMNYYIYKNIFGNGNPTDRILEFCIKIENSGGKEILIQDENKFYDFKHGIDISSPRGKLYIHGNTFFNAIYENSKDFQGTAINAFGFNQTNLYGSEISNNIIGPLTGNDQPRIGIRLSQLDQIKVSGNQINFNHASTPTDPHIGIWVENCLKTKIIDDNIIINKSNFQLGSAGMLLIGLQLDQSAMSCIEENDFIGLGFGMQVIGNSIINSLFQNEFNQFDIGINFVNADIGPNVGTQSTSNSNDGNVMGNTWNCSLCSTVTNNRIAGMYSGTGVDWFTNTNTISDEEFPDNSVLPINSIDVIYLSGTTSSNSECLLPIFPFEEDPGVPLNLRIRNETYGGIVADTSRYPENYHSEFRYLARQMAFSLLKKNPDLIVMDDDSDTSFVSFYNETLTSNINKIDSLETLLANRSYVAADTLLNYFIDTNNIEYNYKRVYRIYIKLKIYGDTSLTETELDELNAIAYENPLIHGKSVFIARNILRLEIYDKELSSARLMNPNKNIKEGKLLIYPNPAREYVKIEIAGIERIYSILITDITGRIIFSGNQLNVINTSSFSPGIYFVKTIYDGGSLNGSFIINR